MRLKSFILAISVLFATSGILATRLAAQNPQEPSIADAARINRQQKKAAAKPGTVITNDTLNPLPASNAPASTAAPTAPATTAPATPSTYTAAQSAASTASTQPQLSQEDSEKLKAEIAALKQELKDKQGEVDLLQRLLNLDREAFYSKPDTSRDTDGKAKLDAEQNELKQKSEEFEKLKSKLQSFAPELTSTQAPPKP